MEKDKNLKCGTHSYPALSENCSCSWKTSDGKLNTWRMRILPCIVDEPHLFSFLIGIFEFCRYFLLDLDFDWVILPQFCFALNHFTDYSPIHLKTINGCNKGMDGLFNTGYFYSDILTFLSPFFYFDFFRFPSYL